MAKENQIVSFYKEHTSLIRLLTPEQAGKLLFAVFDCVFDGKEPDFPEDSEDTPMLKAVYDTVTASALRQAKRYNTNQKISNSMKDNQNAKKESEPIITVEKPKTELYDPYPGDGLY